MSVSGINLIVWRGLAEKNKEFFQVPVPTRKFLINKEKAHFEKQKFSCVQGVSPVHVVLM